MELITERTAFAAHIRPYLRAAVPVESFLMGWALTAGSAVLIDNGKDYELLIEGDASPLEYARILAAAAEAGTAVNTLTLPTTLAEQVSLPDPRDWYWLARTRPFPVAPVPTHTRVVASQDYDAEISRFLQVTAADAAVLPGNPELNFWVVSRGPDSSLQAVAAGTTWSSGARVINSVAVAPDARRQGLGSLVTMLAGQQHFADGAQSVSLGVRGSNLNALAMYRRLDFDVELHFVSARLSRRSLS